MWRRAPRAHSNNTRRRFIFELCLMAGPQTASSPSSLLVLMIVILLSPSPLFPHCPVKTYNASVGEH